VPGSHLQERPGALTLQEREEALRILQRLRAQFDSLEDAPPGALKAIEALIDEYEQKSKANLRTGAGRPHCARTPLAAGASSPASPRNSDFPLRAARSRSLG
jgi:hypothetical protein